LMLSFCMAKTRKNKANHLFTATTNNAYPCASLIRTKASSRPAREALPLMTLPPA
jgi:hypothetical protein